MHSRVFEDGRAHPPSKCRGRTLEHVARDHGDVPVVPVEDRFQELRLLLELQVIELVQAQGLTLAEAGARMGRSAGAAEKLYGRATAQLSRQINAPDEPL